MGGKRSATDYGELRGAKMKKMKKFLILYLSALLLLAVVGCGTRNSATTNEEMSQPVQTVLPEDDINAMTLDVLTFFAEVLEFDPNYEGRRGSALLFVYSLTSVAGHAVSTRYFINRNDFIVILDAYGELISYSDVPAGTIVGITFYGIVAETKPAIIPSAISIQIVE